MPSVHACMLLVYIYTSMKGAVTSSMRSHIASAVDAPVADPGGGKEHRGHVPSPPQPFIPIKNAYKIEIL